VFAYLGFTPDGKGFQLYVSITALNPAGPRLERGPAARLPEAVTRQVDNPADPEAALAGLRSLHRFFAGEEHGPRPLEFGKDDLPLLRKEK